MEPLLNDLLQELEQYGIENDAVAVQRTSKLLNITPDTGQFLSVLVKATQAKSILEIGTSNGYSTLWLADAVKQVGGKVVTVDNNEEKTEQARKNFERAYLNQLIEAYTTSATDFLSSCGSSAFDFIFLDADRSQYVMMWSNLQRVLKPGGLIVVDNVLSHKEEVAEFTSLVESTSGYATSLVPVGKGELIIYKEVS